ncbi:ABC transporter substrate-binding protein [Paenibacillus sp. P96]|uniref:ABC transporter substrate-binding protein n=1 Tax=Paenibacillus zeirhizosphaerae TaxID=2987519 RepID=A0ABT9FKZ8_9BACL|nr:ABC transporter substrate-binding protein [Paenibacillus sp. P96]MDP4095270.1 ABC transporter substrate-binding protein [Paenibacillus sp. P96]
MMKKVTMVWLAMLLLVSLLAGCAGSGNNGEKAEGSDDGSGGGGTLVVGASGDPQTFNPSARADDNFYAAAQNIFSRLIKINNNQEIVPDLAKEWTVSEDGTEITFKLHGDVKWHDGEPFTSADVKFTLDSIREKAGFAVSNLSSMEEVTTPDDSTVVIKLSKPDATFIGYLAWYATFIVPEHIYGGDNWDAGTSVEPVGTGPFKFAEYQTGVSLTLERNDDYFGQVPSVDRLVFSIMTDPNTMVQAFYNGELDILGTDPPSSEVQSMMDNPDVTVNPRVFPSRYYLTFNMEKAPFDKPQVRQAIAYALNNEEMVTRAMKGQGQASTTFISPVYEWALSDEYKVPGYDPERAKQLLEEAGLTPDGSGNYLSVTFKMFEGGAFSDIATVVKDQLSQVGIDVKLNVMDYATWEEEVVNSRDFELTMMGGYQGPDVGAVGSRVGSKGASNFMGYSNPDLDKALAEGVTRTTEEERKPYYEEVQRIMSEDMPIYPISEWVSNIPVHSYIKGDPTSDEAIGHTGFSEYNYVRIEK